MISPTDIPTIAKTDAADAVERVRASGDGGPLLLADRYGATTKFKDRLDQSRAEEWDQALWFAYVSTFNDRLHADSVGLIERLADRPDQVPQNFYVIDRRRWVWAEDDSASGPFIATDPKAGWQPRSD